MVEGGRIRAHAVHEEVSAEHTMARREGKVANMLVVAQVVVAQVTVVMVIVIALLPMVVLPTRRGASERPAHSTQGRWRQVTWASTTQPNYSVTPSRANGRQCALSCCVGIRTATA